ncbi:response regulator transcription factor [Nitrospirillum sp. BR 11828]|uniref:response regulator transcription factor n=1 Tax=Nitrospirillum sp. BR 11828 TaxID=3104325 RepID=UPI002ACA5BAD|nr:response regulator transcription factor [Nitrospirillum sp. BR 11828]MDZ5649603.1 response regulator transcription factor [Nitrospirillum sp. BR 11828]
MTPATANATAWQTSGPWLKPNDVLPAVPARVVLVDDDEAFREAATGELEDLGFTVTGFPDAKSLIQYLTSADGAGLDDSVADILVVDWCLERTLGIDLLPDLRRRGCRIPVIFLTGMSMPANETLALDRGAVDFIDKTRGMSVLARRIRLILQPPTATAPTPTTKGGDEIVCGNLTLKPKVNRAFWRGRDVMLTVTEFSIVEFMVANLGEHVTYRAIYDRVHWSGFIAGSGEDGYRTNVRSSIKRIRSKFNAIDRGFAEIENFAAFGYRWRDPASIGIASPDVDGPEDIRITHG